MVLGGRAKILATLPQVRLQGKYSKLNAVGSGAYGEVWKVLDLASGRIFVQKEAILAKVDGSFANEIATLTKLRHPNIVSFVEWGMDEGKMCIVLEFVTGGSLDDVIHQLKEPMPEARIREYVRQILFGLDYCHTHGVVHRDIKAKNILVTSEGTLKLADFGGAKEAVELMGTGLMQATAGLQATLLWMAPELHDSRFNCKADIWSLGCTIIEMATRKKPWDEQNFENFFAAMKFLKKVKSGPPMPENLSPAAKAFLSRCFTRDYTLRPSAKELLEDDWFRTAGGSLTSPFEFTAGSISATETSTGSEAPQGPSASTPNPGSSDATSVSEVKFNVGDGVLSTSRETSARSTISSLVDDYEEAMNRNWIFELAPSQPKFAAIAAEPLPGPTGPETLLTTMDFLSMKAADDD